MDKGGKRGAPAPQKSQPTMELTDIPNFALTLKILDGDGWWLVESSLSVTIGRY